jgi:hypothetical protein
VPWRPEVFTAPTAEARRAQEEAARTNDDTPYYEGMGLHAGGSPGD